MYNRKNIYIINSYGLYSLIKMIHILKQRMKLNIFGSFFFELVGIVVVLAFCCFVYLRGLKCPYWFLWTYDFLFSINVEDKVMLFWYQVSVLNLSNLHFSTFVFFFLKKILIFWEFIENKEKLTHVTCM